MHDHGQEHPEVGRRGGVEQGRGEGGAGEADEGGRDAHAEALPEEEGDGEVDAGVQEEEDEEAHHHHPEDQQQ